MQVNQVVNILEKTSSDCKSKFSSQREIVGLTDVGQGGHARMGMDKEAWYLQPIYKLFNSIIR